MKYYVTGASGFIGRHLTDYLREHGHTTVALSRPLNVEVIDTNEPFCFVHLSAYGNHYDQTDYHQTLVANVYDLAGIINHVNCEKLVKFYNVSTSAIQLEKQTLYTATKLVGEMMIERLHDSRFVNVRPYSVYGPGEADHRFIPTLIRALHSGETIKLDPFAIHDWIYVTDFIDAMFKGYKYVGTGIPRSNIDIVQELENISGKKLNYEVTKLRSYDNKDWYCYDGVPNKNMADGLKQTYEHFTQAYSGNKQKA